MLLDLLPWEVPFESALQEALPLLVHLLGFFFFPMARRSKSASPRRVAGQPVGDLHHLFLVDDDAVGLLQHLLQLGQRRR